MGYFSGWPRAEIAPSVSEIEEHLVAVNEYAVRVKAALDEHGYDAEQLAGLSPQFAIAALILGIK
jgi:hypothetical protein